MLNKRASGVLMHISSLPGKTGIGTMGKNAYRFIDCLKNANQKYWQILPICPTSYGDSPYQSFSTFAGNPYFIDLETLADEGFISKADYENVSWCGHENYVDYGTLYVERHKVFEKLYANFVKKIPSDYEAFVKENDWLEDYSLFMSIKDAHNGASFSEWEEEIRKRDKTALKEWRKKCADRMNYYKMLQYFFFKQWFQLKEYANKNEIEIIGDIPIYVAADSSDVWANPDQFMLDENFVPVEVAGCPPDAFSADGQLWGNPVYNWEHQKKTGYTWWKKRLEKSLKIYDVIRIDHFRGFEAFYCISFGATTAKKGQWRKGPGMDLFNSLKKKFGDMPVIAEDLGFLTEEVHKLLRDSGFPGMKVLQFAFGNRDESDYIPYRYIKNCIVYTGTHDNDTILGWTKNATEKEVESAKEYLRVTKDEDVVKEMMIAGLSSVANTCVLTMQDLLGLGSEARINTPSTVGDNWKWRAGESMFNEEIYKWLGFYTKLYGRC